MKKGQDIKEMLNNINEDTKIKGIILLI